MSISPHEIRQIRQNLGLTQTELAKRLQTTRSAVAKWEGGECRPRGPAEVLLRMLASLGIAGAK